MAYSVFGDKLDMSNIRLKTAWWVLKNYAVSPNGNVYFHPDDWIEDFAKVGLGKRSWLIHELTHVWQLQQGVKVVRGAIINRRYDYVFEQGKSFCLWHRATSPHLQDYYIRREQGKRLHRTNVYSFFANLAR